MLVAFGVEEPVVVDADQPADVLPEVHEGAGVVTAHRDAEGADPHHQCAAEEVQRRGEVGLVDRQTPLVDVPAAVVLVPLVDQGVHEAHVDGESPAVAVACHPARFADRDGPGLRLAESSDDRVPGEAAGRDQQVGGTAEAVAADQGELEQDVVGVLAEPPIDGGAAVAESGIDPVRCLLDECEEVAQGVGRIGGHVAGEGPLELAHRDPAVGVPREAHGPNQRRGGFVSCAQPTPELRELVVAGFTEVVVDLEQSADAPAAGLGGSMASREREARRLGGRVGRRIDGHETNLANHLTRFNGGR